MSTATAQHEALQSMGRDGCDHDPELFRSVLDRIGDKWSLFLIGALEDGPVRFTQLLRVTPGISRRMLTATLRALERDGLVSRTIHAEVPPRVEYAVTELGRSLTEPVRALATWASNNQNAILAHRNAFDAGPSAAQGRGSARSAATMSAGSARTRQSAETNAARTTLS